MAIPNRQATIKQVAQEAGVSTQTISRVLNNRPDVAPETRARVQAVIDRLGYQPSAIARSLIRRRSHTLGVALAEVGQYGPMRRLLGMEQAANELGYSLHLNLVHQPENAEISEQVLDELLSWHVDGVIWAVPEIGNNRFWLRKKISHLSVPVIFVGGGQSVAHTIVVSVDNRAGGKIATEHLLAQGYRHIGHISGPLNWPEARERHIGWRDALSGVEARQIFEGNWSSVDGERGLVQLLKQFPQMDAVFVANDQMALGVLRAAHQLGVRVPQDLGVVGFDNTPEAVYYWPSLTSVRHQLFSQGELVVRELVYKVEMKHADKPRLPELSVVSQPELFFRESSVKNGILQKGGGF